MTQHSDRSVFLMLLSVAMLWGGNVVMVKYLTGYFPPLALAPIRLTLATALLLPLVLNRYGRQLPPRDTWLPILGVASCSIFFHQLSMSIGTTLTSGTHAVLILGLNPLFTVVLASLLVKESLTWSKAVGVLLGFGGAALLAGYGTAQGTATVAGDLWMVFSMITYVLGSLFVKRATASVSPLVVTAYSHLLGSVGLVMLGLAANDRWYYDGVAQPWPLAVMLFSSFVCTALGAIWWNTGIRQVGASVASLFLSAIPVFGVFASAFFLSEDIRFHHLAALLLVTLGVSLGTGVMRPDRLWSRRRLGE